jgi:uncharacterized integral membrane protein
MTEPATTGSSNGTNVARIFVTVVIIAAVVAFILQNRQDIPVDFLFLTVTMSLWLLIVVFLVLGALLGFMWQRRRASRQ